MVCTGERCRPGNPPGTAHCSVHSEYNEISAHKKEYSYIRNIARYINYKHKINNNYR